MVADSASVTGKIADEGSEFLSSLTMIARSSLFQSVFMISKSPDDLAAQEIESASESFLGPVSTLEQWLDDLPSHWSNSVASIRSTPAIVVSDRGVLKQFRFGINRELVEQLNPLIKQISKPATREEALESLVAMAESALGTLGACQQNPAECKTSESVAALSILLAASRLRNVAVAGGEGPFRRLLRCLLSALAIGETASSNDALLYQWLSIELPLRITTELSALKPFQDEAKISLLRFVGHTREQMDSDAWPQATILCQFAPLAASWIRCIDCLLYTSPSPRD